MTEIVRWSFSAGIMGRFFFFWLSMREGERIFFSFRSSKKTRRRRCRLRRFCLSWFLRNLRHTFRGKRSNRSIIRETPRPFQSLAPSACERRSSFPPFFYSTASEKREREKKRREKEREETETGKKSLSLSLFFFLLCIPNAVERKKKPRDDFFPSQTRAMSSENAH